MLHVRHAAAAIEAGLCKTVLITHGESGQSRIGRTAAHDPAPTACTGSSKRPTASRTPPTMFTIPVLRYMKTYGMTHEQLAMVAVVQREWAAKNPRATMKEPITVADVLNSRMIAYPFRLLECCLVTDGGGALILTSADRAKDFPTQARLHPRHRRERRDADGQPDGGLHFLARVPGRRPARVRGSRDHARRRRPSDDLRRLRASAAVSASRISASCRATKRPLHRGPQHARPAASCRSTPTAAACPTCTPACTACTRCRRACGRCAAPRRRRCPMCRISVCHGVGGMFAASGTIIFTNERH